MVLLQELAGQLEGEIPGVWDLVASRAVVLLKEQNFGAPRECRYAPPPRLHCVCPQAWRRGLCVEHGLKSYFLKSLEWFPSEFSRFVPYLKNMEDFFASGPKADFFCSRPVQNVQVRSVPWVMGEGKETLLEMSPGVRY